MAPVEQTEDDTCRSLWQMVSAASFHMALVFSSAFICIVYCVCQFLFLSLKANKLVFNLVSINQTEWCTYTYADAFAFFLNYILRRTVLKELF